MSILTRKRRRSEAFHDEAEEQQERTQDAADGSDNGGDDGATSVAEVSEERAKKEREVWDAFREEQYESVSFRMARMLGQDNPDG